MTETNPHFPLKPTHPLVMPSANFHTHCFPDGEIMHGVKSAELLIAEAGVIFKNSVEGQTVLDIGAWDGFFSFEAERRGAARVLATDNFCWSGPGWGTRQGFEYAHHKFGSQVEALDVDVLDLDAERIGQFDTVMFLGVLYHVKDPLRCIELVCSLAKKTVICDTETALDKIPEPIMRYFLGDEMNGDPTNFWAPNMKCLEAMFREFGFQHFEFTDHPLRQNDGDRARIIMHASR